MKILKKSIKWLAIILGITLALFFTYFISVFVSANSIKLTEDVLSKNFFNLQVLDINGNAIEITNEYSKIEPYELNENVINAITSIEDKRFFEHNGIDILRIGKASINNALSLSFKEGASTITQQLIKNTLLSSEKTITRKIKEINLALRAEKTFSKEEILSLYLSAIYFGNGNNGLKEGAKYYFSKDVKDLNVLESATLAGIVKAPTAYSPISNPKKALERRNVVLKAMKDNNKITELEYQEYVKLPLNLNVSDKSLDNDYINYLLTEVEQVLKDENFTSKGYTVYSYYTPIKNSQTATNSQYDNTQLILGNNGEILYINESKNNSINKRSNIASLIKPLLYAVALDENVITPAT
ncbi:MAG: penicillin-binding protein, partial [Clostridia bacterium]|nr:penicillin-binding protein [Clostridia bacterium]